MWHGIKLRVQLAGEPRKLTLCRQVRMISNQGAYLLDHETVKKKRYGRYVLSRGRRTVGKFFRMVLADRLQSNYGPIPN